MYNPTLILDLAETTLTFANNNLHWCYVRVTVVVDPETDEETQTAAIVASEAHIDPLQYWESGSQIHYKIGHFSAVVGGKREAHLLWNSSKQPEISAQITITQAAHAFTVGTAIKLFGSTWVKSKADTRDNAGTVGLVSEVIDADHFRYVTGGLLPGTYTQGAQYFLSTATAGQLMIVNDLHEWEIGQVGEFIGTGTANGLEIEIDAGYEICEAVIPTSIWDLTGIDRTGWTEGKVLKFDTNGNLIVGTDLQGDLEPGIQLADLSAVGAISYNPLTGVFSITSGYIVPTTTEKGRYDTAFGWGNHANAGYLTAITKAMVEAVLTGQISTHTHNYLTPELAANFFDYYYGWGIYTGGAARGTVRALNFNGNNVEFVAGSGLSVAYSYASVRHFLTYNLDIMSLTNIMNPSDTHYMAIQSSSLPSRISLAQLKAYIGSTGGVTDHGALTGLADDDHTQYYNQARGDARYAQVAGSSSQNFATKNLTAAETITATGDVKGETFTFGATGWSFAVSGGKFVIKYNGTALMSLDTSGNINAVSEIYRGGL